MASDGRLSKVMTCQYKAAIRADHPNLIPAISEDDVRIWHFLVVNLPPPFIDGEYIFRLDASTKFPADPPTFEFLTKNGVYETGVKTICISIGIFHAGAAPGRTGSYGWRPVLGMIGFAREVVNGMLNTKELGSGIGIHVQTPIEQTILAESSVAYNAKKYPKLMAQFEAFAASNPTHQAVRAWLMFRMAARVLRMNWQTVALDDLLPLISKSVEEDLWSVFDSSLRYLIEEIPDFPVAQLVPMGFPANGRTILLRVADPLRVLLREREVSVRRVLGLLLHARTCLELVRGEEGRPEVPDTVLQEWTQKFRKGFAEFLEALPGVCGHACARIVPDACRLLLETPSAFTKDVHDRLSDFLCTTDIDKKENLGKALSTQIQLSISR